MGTSPIDKVYATVPVDTTNAAHIKQIKVAFKVIMQIEGFKPTKKNDYEVSLSSNNNTYGKDGDMLLQYGPNSHEHNNYLRFVVNPSKNHVGVFRKLVAMIVPGGYDVFINKAKLNRFDYTFDIHGLSLNDLLMSYPRMGINRVFRKVKLLETLEMGTDPKKIVAYDKNAHLKHLNKKLNPVIHHVISDHAVTRIEVRHYRKVTYGFKEVHLQPNPFEKLTLMLYPNSCCMKGEDPTWHMFIDLCRQKGIDRALECQICCFFRWKFFRGFGQKAVFTASVALATELFHSRSITGHATKGETICIW